MWHYENRGLEPVYDLAPEERPTFNDLQDNAKTGLIKHGVARYLFSRNPERSIKQHTYLGAALVRAAIMGTYGRLIPRSGGRSTRRLQLGMPRWQLTKLPTGTTLL